jgi:excisionase family DNA binding protein
VKTITYVPNTARKIIREERRSLDYNNLPIAISPREAALILRISSDSYYRHIQPLIAKGEIKSYTIGRKRLIITKSLLRWQERQAEEQ